MPKEMGVEADKALVIPVGDSYMIVPIPRGPIEFDLEGDRQGSQREGGEKACRRGQDTRPEETSQIIIESDLFVPYSKKSDWLKRYADPLLELINDDKLRMSTSAAVMIELHYVPEDHGFDKTSVLGKHAEIVGVKG